MNTIVDKGKQGFMIMLVVGIAKSTINLSFRFGEIQIRNYSSLF